MRANNRFEARIPVDYQAGSNGRGFGEIIDISADGFRLKVSSRNLFVLDKIEISLNCIGKIKAIVKWLERGNVIGCQFVNEISEEDLFNLLSSTSRNQNVVCLATLRRMKIEKALNRKRNTSIER